MWCPKRLEEFIAVNDSLTADITNFIESIFRTIGIYEYHKSEAFSIIHSIESNCGKQAFKWIMEPNMGLAVQAHIHSAIHNARELYDLTAQLLNAILIEEKDRIKIHDCNINDVVNKLSDSELKSTIVQAISSESYKYVNGFVNTIKHRNLVKFNSVIYLEPLYSIDVFFDSFGYRGTQYPSRSAKDALQSSLDVKNDIISIGESLERHLNMQA